MESHLKIPAIFDTPINMKELFRVRIFVQKSLYTPKPSEYNKGEKTKIGETAVCNLRFNKCIKSLMKMEKLDYDKLKNSIHTAVRMLDNVIDINFYPTKEASNSNLRNRPVGLGYGHS